MLRIHRTEGPSGESVLSLSGSLRASILDSLARELESAIAEGSPVLDLAELTYVDRAGVEFLRRTARHAGLRHVPPFIRALLEDAPEAGE